MVRIRRRGMGGLGSQDRRGTSTVGSKVYRARASAQEMNPSRSRAHDSRFALHQTSRSKPSTPPSAQSPPRSHRPPPHQRNTPPSGRSRPQRTSSLTATAASTLSRSSRPPPRSPSPTLDPLTSSSHQGRTISSPSRSSGSAAIDSCSSRLSIASGMSRLACGGRSKAGTSACASLPMTGPPRSRSGTRGDWKFYGRQRERMPPAMRTSRRGGSCWARQEDTTRSLRQRPPPTPHLHLRPFLLSRPSPGRRRPRM